MKRKQIITIGCVMGIAALWFIAAQFFGPNSPYGIKQEVERLQNDSIALQADFRPTELYTESQDINTAITELRDLGDPLRFGRTQTDSVRLFNNPETAKIANYNKAKCDSVLSEVLPLWRMKLVFLIEKQLDTRTEVIRIHNNDTTEPSIELYSLRYADQKQINEDVKKLNYIFRNLGFKTAFYSISPNNQGVEYTFN